MTRRRETYGEGSRFEELVAYSRAVRSGGHVAVSGTAPIEAGGLVHPGDAYEQTLFSLRKALVAAEALGARKEDVLRTGLLLAPGRHGRTPSGLTRRSSPMCDPRTRPTS